MRAAPNNAQCSGRGWSVRKATGPELVAKARDYGDGSMQFVVPPPILVVENLAVV